MTYPAPDVSRATRGRFLRRHGARVIEQDDLLIIEFVHGEPWYTAGTADPAATDATKRSPVVNAPTVSATLPRIVATLLAFLIASASALYGVARWIRWT